METPCIEEIKDKIYYEHLEDILAHAELRHLAKDEKQHVDDQRERIHKMLDLIVELISTAHQAGVDETVDKKIIISRDGKYVSISGVIYAYQDGALSPLADTIKALQDKK